jgi:hypothetical protein
VGEQEQEKQLVTKHAKTLIIDQTNKSFDREAFLKRLKQGNLTKVTQKPVLEKAREMEPVSVAPENEIRIKKPKKITKKKLVLQQDEEQKQEQENEPLAQEQEPLSQEQEPLVEEVTKEVIQALVPEKNRKNK